MSNYKEYPDEVFDNGWNDTECLVRSKKVERWNAFWNVFFLLAIIATTFLLTVVLCKYWNNQMRIASMLFRQGDYESAFNAAGHIPKFYLT